MFAMEFVYKQYNWRGRHVAYVSGNTTIPCDDGNNQYRELVSLIEKGEIEVREPEITWSKPTFDQDGRRTGYCSNIGFIPDDTQNRLCELHDEAIQGGRCEQRSPETSVDNPRITSLTFSIILERGWSHLQGPFTRAFKYRSNSSSPGIDLNVSIQNLISTKCDALPAVFEAMDAKVHLPPGASLKTIQAGLISIEFPVDCLLRLYKGERQRLHDHIKPMVLDSLEMHYVMSGRSEKRGPSRVWLLENAKEYLSYAVTDLANLALQEFAVEYGGRVPGHVSEMDTLARSIVFATRADCKNELYRFAWSGEQSFSLEGRWRQRAAPKRTARMDLNYVCSRLRQLFDAGFAMEALVVANSTFEVTLDQTFLQVAGSASDCVGILRKKGHAFRLELLEKLHDSKIEPSLNFSEFTEFVKVMSRVYDIRNDYVHQLIMPASDFLNLAEIDRTVARVLPFLWIRICHF